MNLAVGSDLRAHLHLDVAVGRISQLRSDPAVDRIPQLFVADRTPQLRMNLAVGPISELTSIWTLLSAASRNSDRTLPLTASRNFSLLTALHDSA